MGVFFGALVNHKRLLSVLDRSSCNQQTGSQ
jgi:hypothetical protein